MRHPAVVFRELIQRPEGVSAPGITIPLAAWMAEII